MKATQITLIAKTEMVQATADYINGLAMANGFSTPFNANEKSQYKRWFENQVAECDEWVAENLKIEIEEIELDDEE